jgi:hypothetical protein
MSGFCRSLWRNANSAPEIFSRKVRNRRKAEPASLSSCRRLYQRSTCRRTPSLSYSGSMRQANRFGFSNGQNRKAAAYKISAGRSGLASFFFGGQISVSPPWSARARRHGDGRSSEDTVPDLLLSSMVRAQHRRPIPQYAIAVSRRSLHMCTRSGRHYWGLWVCERLVALWASQHGYLTYHVTGQFL